MPSEFEVERGELMTNLTLLEDHGYGSAPRCPYCMEKHTSKIAGYADEIAAGKEGDEQVMSDLADKAKEWRSRVQSLKAKPVESEFEAIGIEARNWRRKIQGAHSHAENEVDLMKHQVKEICDAKGINCFVTGP